MAGSAAVGRRRTGRGSGVDALTGLPRGGEFEGALNRLIQATPQTPIGVLLVGVDRFRHVNALLGYASGDQALKAITARLLEWLPTGAVLARLGGDEFGILLPGFSEEHTTAAADAVLHQFRQPVRAGRRDVFLSVSAGLNHFPSDDSSAEALLRSASEALERAKQRGGNTWDRFGFKAGLRPEERYRLESALRHAIERNELSLRYQPQVDRMGELCGFEALLSWQRAGHGRVETETFIRLAEEIGAIGAIGAWVLRTACLQWVEWQAAGLNPPRLAVNVSPLEFASPDFVTQVRAVLAEVGVAGSCLEFEITEGAMLRDIDESAARMAELRSLGIRIAVDDFGVGYSPLTYLHRLPLDTVKVDRTFISQITKPSGSLPVVHTISVLAHHRGLQVVAEGVETVEELELIRAARCDLAQGYLFGPPLGAEETSGLLAAHLRPGAAFAASGPSSF